MSFYSLPSVFFCIDDNGIKIANVYLSLFEKNDTTAKWRQQDISLEYTEDLTMIQLLDTTLREGEQTVGVNFTLDQKTTIIDGLARVGISEIEIGIASPLSRNLHEIIRFCRDRHPTLKTSLWCRCKIEDITYAATIAPDVLSLSMPASDLLLSKKLGKNRKWAQETLSSTIRLAHAKGLKISVGFEDATRAESSFLLHMAALARDAGAFRIRIADTVGIATPLQLVSLIKDLKSTAEGCEIAVHTHNDFGMATANAISALESGANWADVTILGLGERSGCARLEEVAGYLGILRASAQLHVEHLKSLSEYVSKIIGKNIEDSRPLIGKKIFACETGLHLHGLQMDHTTYEPFPPEKVGASRHLIYGAKCGRKALRLKLADLGHEVNEDLPLHKIRCFRDKALFSLKGVDDGDPYTMMPAW